MRNSDIKVKHIYNVIFDPVHNCEFDGRHLALVLSKNPDGKTVIVVPLTSSSNGLGSGKICLGKIATLPTSFSSFDTYAVVNQVRTVNADRFISLKEGSNIVESVVDDRMFECVLEESINQLAYYSELSIKINVFDRLLCKEKINKAVKIANLVKKSSFDSNEREKKLIEINHLLDGVPYDLHQPPFSADIETIILEAKKFQ